MGAALPPFHTEDAAAEVSPEGVEEWFIRPPYAPAAAPWRWIEPERSKELRRLVRYLAPLFDYGGDWFSASRDEPERIEAFCDAVRAGSADGEVRVYVFRKPDQGVWTTVDGFLECWPRLRLEGWGYDVVPPDASFHLRVLHSGTAHLAPRRASSDAR